MKRQDGRGPDELREIRITKNFMKNAHGSVLIEWGGTRVLCTAMFGAQVPAFLEGKGSGWLTAEYAMLPGSTPQRKPRAVIKPDGRSTEIGRLIGRSLRSVTDLQKIDGYTIYIDCDVIEADGGTRTAAITGAYTALALCVQKMLDMALIEQTPLRSSVAAVSCGIVKDTPLLDLNYLEDSSAIADVNVVMSGGGGVIEIQGTGERRPMTRAEVDKMLKMAERGIAHIADIQEEVLKRK